MGSVGQHQGFARWHHSKGKSSQQRFGRGPEKLIDCGFTLAAEGAHRIQLGEIQKPAAGQVPDDVFAQRIRSESIGHSSPPGSV